MAYIYPSKWPSWIEFRLDFHQKSVETSARALGPNRGFFRTCIWESLHFADYATPWVATKCHCRKQL